MDGRVRKTAGKRQLRSEIHTEFAAIGELGFAVQAFPAVPGYLCCQPNIADRCCLVLPGAASECPSSCRQSPQMALSCLLRSFEIGLQ